MRAVLKHIVASTYKPLLEKYLSRTRIFCYEGIRLEIPPPVFHPGFFFSTRLLLHYLKRFSLKGKSFFEPGCGSGLLSIYAAKNGAVVTASDINSTAVEFLNKNAAANQVELNIIHSDLFERIPPKEFDFIAINPPYYRKQPVTETDYAWNCGLNGEFFSSLFKDLDAYKHTDSVVLMVLFDGCDLEMIETFAENNNFRMLCVYRKNHIIEKNFIYRIVKKE